MSWPDLIYAILTGFGTKIVVIIAILVILISIALLVLKKRGTFIKARAWLFEPINKELAANKKELSESIAKVHSEVVQSNFDNIRSRLITQANFIASAVKDGNYSEVLFQNYAHSLGEYMRLSSEYDLRDGEVVSALRQVDQLYAQTHDGQFLFGELMIAEVQKKLIGD